MRAGIACLFLCLLLGAGSARGEAPGYMSIYLDAGATTWQNGSVAAFSAVPLYVCLTNCAFPEIQGYEFGYFYTGNTTVIGTQFQGVGAQDAGGSGSHQVTLEAPLETAPVTVLAIITLFLLDANPVELKLLGLDSGIPGAQNLPAVTLPDGGRQPICPAFWDGDAPTICTTINEWGGVFPSPKTYDCYGTLPARPWSWDSVKSLYR